MHMLAPSRNVLVMSISTAAFVAAIFTWNRLLPLYLRDLGANDLQVSLSFAILTAASALGQLPGGILADRFGRKPLVVYPTYAAALLYLAAGLSGSWIALVSTFFVLNLSGAVQSPAFVACLAESVDPRQRGQAFGAFQFFIGLSLVIGPALGAVLLPRGVGIRSLILVTTAVALMVAVGRHRYLVETLTASGKRGRLPLTSLLRGRLLTVILVGVFFISIQGLTVYGPFMALYSKDVQVFTDAQINLFFGLGAASAMVVSLAGGRIIEAYGSRLTLAGAVIGHVLTIVAWIYTRDFWTACLWFGLAYGFLQLGIIAYDTLRTEVASAYAAGAALGAIGTATVLLTSLSQPLAGALKTSFGPAVPFWLALIFGGLTVFFTVRLGVRGNETAGTTVS